MNMDKYFKGERKKRKEKAHKNTSAVTISIDHKTALVAKYDKLIQV